MKKFLYLFPVIFAVLSCGKENPVPKPVPVADITFELTADYATKDVQTDWEAGNVIFVFFNQSSGLTEVESPSYLEMKFNGSKWSYTVKNGPLGIKNHDTGTMRAVYLPFGNTTTVEDGEDCDYEFGTKYKSFFLTATLPYTVTDNKVKGNFAMKVPDGYVQFYVEDPNPVDGAYTLSTDAVRPVEIVSVLMDGTLNLNELRPGDDMPGYKYKNGYLFSGVIVPEYHENYGGNYYFAKTKLSDGSRSDYFVGGKTMLVSRDSRKLPANGNAKWEPVGPSKTVKLTGSTKNYGTWYTCNEGSPAPDEPGTRMDFAAATAHAGTNKILPSYDQMYSIYSDLTWTPISVYRTPGWVVSANSGFLFFPLDDLTLVEWYWTRTEVSSNHDRAWHLYLEHKGDRIIGESPKSMMYPARYLYAEP